MSNPLISQGTLNRLKASITWAAFPELNVTAPYLSREGIRLSLQGNSTLFLPTMTGQIQSQEPYLGIEVTINLLKPQQLADQYKVKMETDANLGDGIIRPDLNSLNPGTTGAGLSPFQVVNCAIQNVREVDFSGDSALFTVVVGGYYLVNSNLFG